MTDKEKRLCVSCGKETPHTSHEAQATFYDRRGKPETTIITIYTCDVCGRVSGT